MASSHALSALQRGRKVLSSAMKMPRARPPTSARGRLTRRPSAAAAMATTTRLKKSAATNVLNRGAISTPAMPAKILDSAQAKADTRSARMPASSVMRGLSTTARIASPRAVKRNRAASTSMPSTATPRATSSLRLKA
jgi:hypothetical protein